MLPKEGFGCYYNYSFKHQNFQEIITLFYLALLWFFPKNMYCMLSDFYQINMNQQSHICFQYSRKLLTVYLFFNQKKAQAQVLAGSAWELFKLPFWGILPCFLVYAAFLFMPFTPENHQWWGGGNYA